MSLTQEQQDQLNYLVQWVSARVDELMPNAQTADAPVPYIEEELNKAALYILRSARKQLVYSAAVTKTGSQLTVNQGEGKVIILCPNDYIRFIRLRIKDWKRAVDQVISVDANQYRQQSNKFLSGDAHKPVAALTPALDGIGMQIEATQVNTASGASDQVLQFTYVPRLKAYDMPEDLVDPMVWLAASRALTILRQPNLAQQAMANMQQSMDQLLVGLYGEEMPTMVQQRQQ